MHAIARTGAILLAAFVAATVIAYWPGLHGGFVFDDFAFVVDNADVHVATLRASDWIAAALSFPAGHQGRWLTMLTFAANHYLTGLDPFWMKLVNLAIHLANGLAAFAVVRGVLALERAVKASTRTHDDIVAALVAGAWLLLPVNLTAVLYVAQRLESLSDLFVLLGLWLYLRARLDRHRQGGGLVRIAAILIGFTALGLTAKESAVLLPLYALCVELALPRWRNANAGRDRGLAAFHGALIAAPLVAGMIWLLGWMHGVSTYTRSFTITERLLTEARVLWMYIDWTLLPRLRALSFFHDDIALSRGILDPPSTLAAIVGLAALLASAFWLRRSRPLWCLGILWFFAGQSLTCTIIPLELAFEHRNYFPSLGLLLAIAGLLAVVRDERWERVAPFACAAAIALFALTTALRAREWSDPLRMAAAEASKRPASANAQYEYAHLLVLTGKPELLDRAVDVLASQVSNPASSILPEDLLIEIAAARKREIAPDWWRSLTAKLERRAPAVPDIDALVGLTQCQNAGRCPPETRELLAAFMAALSHPMPSASLLAAYAGFAATRLDDLPLAEKALRDAIARAPTQFAYRADLVQLTLLERDATKSQTELAALDALARSDSQRHRTAALRAQLIALRGAAPTTTDATEAPNRESR